MIKKARLSALVGLLAFFIPALCYPVGHKLTNGTCVYMAYDYWGPDHETRSTYTGVVQHADFVDSMPINWINPQYNVPDNYYKVVIKSYTWNDNSSSWTLYKSYQNGIALNPAQFTAMKTFMDSSISLMPSTKPLGMCTAVCDAGDTDGDGVCNSCDKSPGLPDPKDCVYLTSRNAAGQVVDMMIDEGCKGSAGDNIASYRDEDAASLGDGRLYYDLTAHDREMDSRTCNASTGADADGNCDCAYPPTNTKLAGFTDASGGAAVLSPAAESEYQAAKNLDDDDKLDDCAAVKNRCEAACSTRGGVVTNTCSSESGSLRSSCTCANNELAYDLDNESSDDSDNTSADSDGDGVPDSIDPDSTGGSDSNSDNVDDIAAAVKGAVAALNLGGKLDAVNGNLNSIGNSVSNLGGKITGVTSAVNAVGSAVSGLGSKIDGVGNSVNGLGSKIDGVGSAVSGLGSKIDGVGSSVDGLGTSLGGKLDDLGDKLDGISDKLDDGLEATGSADLPGSNEYNTDLEELEEQSFVDTVHNFLNSSLPVLSSISGSGLTASGSPSMSTEIWGKSIALDFSDWQGVLRAAGLVLVAVATIFAFIIIL